MLENFTQIVLKMNWYNIFFHLFIPVPTRQTMEPIELYSGWCRVQHSPLNFTISYILSLYMFWQYWITKINQCHLASLLIKRLTILWFFFRSGFKIHLKEEIREFPDYINSKILWIWLFKSLCTCFKKLFLKSNQVW